MSKIICDICGTSYPETADQCPICGSAKDVSLSLTDELLEEEETSAASRAKGGRFAASNVRKRNTRRYEEPDEEDYDDDDDEDDDEYEDDYDDDDDEPQSNTPLVVLLIVVIAALLVVTGFIFVKYFVPNILPEETTVPTTVAATTLPEETTEPTIPCDSLALTSGGDILLEQEGQEWLVNVMALPENTTDEMVYTSSDESVVTVNEEGKLTAVGEGEAVITVTCGAQSIECNVVCAFVEETTAPEETTLPEETTEPTEPLKDITLKVIYWPDLTFDGPNQGHTFVLDGLSNTEVKWTSENENIVTVDENGFVISVGSGQTKIICEYGDQKIEIPVNCRW